MCCVQWASLLAAPLSLSATARSILLLTSIGASGRRQRGTTVGNMPWKWLMLSKFPSFNNQWTTAQKLRWFDDYRRLCKCG